MTDKTAVGEATDQATDPELQIRAAVVMLRVGGVICFPTDTLYALGADPFDVGAVERIHRAKGRDHEKPLPVLLADIEQLTQVAIDVPDNAWKLARRYWPGALTMVVKRSPDISEIVSGGLTTLAVRVPDHPIARKLIREFGRPVIGTSANRAGGADSHSLDDVLRELGPWLDYAVGEGTLPAGQPSTIVDLTASHPQVLREGAIPADEVMAAIADSEPSDASSPRSRRTHVGQ